MVTFFNNHEKLHKWEKRMFYNSPINGINWPCRPIVWPLDKECLHFLISTNHYRILKFSRRVIKVHNSMIVENRLLQTLVFFISFVFHFLSQKWIFLSFLTRYTSFQIHFSWKSLYPNRCTFSLLSCIKTMSYVINWLKHHFPRSVNMYF